MIDRYARAVSNLTPTGTPYGRDEFRRTIKMWAFNATDPPETKWSPYTPTRPICLDPFKWVVTLTDRVFEKPELAYPPFCHAQQILLMARALIHWQLPMPDQMKAFSQGMDRVATVQAATQLPNHRLVIAKSRGRVTGDPFELAKHLISLNFSPGRIRPTAGESFLQPPPEGEVNRVEATVRIRIQHYKGVLALKRQQLANLVDHFRSNIVTFLEMKQDLQTNHALLTPGPPDLDFPADLSMFINGLSRGALFISPLSNPHTLTARIRHQIALMHGCSDRLRSQWQQNNIAAPMPASLQKMHEIVHRLQVLTRELDLVSLEWFSMELPDVNDRNRFMFKYNDGHGVELRQDLGGPRPSRIRRPA